MTKEQLINELKFDMQIFARCKGIKISNDDAEERAVRYVEQLSVNVRIQNIEMVNTIVENIDMSDYYYEIMFRTFMVFKNEFNISDKIFMIVRKDER